MATQQVNERLAALTAAGTSIWLDQIGRQLIESGALRPVYDETDGYDGYVSFEVDPDLAFDTNKTMEQAREYWQRVDRPNLMIKIPGTDEGTPAIEQMIYEGLNINVTLLFSVAAY